MDEIVNKVQKSGLITIALSDFLPSTEIIALDIKEQLWQGLVLKEKDFREFLKENNWEQYRGEICTIFCSVDAIVPTWAYMLIAKELYGIASKVFFGNKEVALLQFAQEKIQALEISEFTDARIVIKGCSEVSDPTFLFVELMKKFQGSVKSILYGEPCSTVPIYKRPKE
ncbi:MAG: DUF2480 family protein [Crocinitomicaceae bacterium]